MERRRLAVWNRSQELYDAELQSTLTQIHMERTASGHSLASMDGSRSSSLRSLGSIGNLGSLGELPSPELVRTLLQYPTNPMATQHIKHVGGRPLPFSATFNVTCWPTLS